jgi:hypothetical protein
MGSVARLQAPDREDARGEGRGRAVRMIRRQGKQDAKYPLIAEMPVDADADLDIFLLVGAAVGEVGDKIMRHQAEFESVVEVVVDAAAKSVGEARSITDKGITIGVETRSRDGYASQALAEEAALAIPDRGGDVAMAVGEPPAPKEAGLVDVDLVAEIGDGEAVEGRHGAEAMEKGGAVIDRGSAKIKVVGGGTAEELGALLGKGHAQV